MSRPGAPLLAFAFFVLSLVGPSSAQDTHSQVRLDPAIRPIHYELTVTPDADAMTLSGVVTITLQVDEPTREIALHALDLDFDHVTLDGRQAASVRMQDSDQTARIGLAEPLSPGRHQLAIAYSGHIYRQAQGLFARDYDLPAGGRGRMLVSQFQAADARRFLPSFDEPEFRATFDVTVIAPADREIVANMPAIANEAAAGGMQRVRFATTPSMPTYLLFLGIGDFERISADVDGVTVSIITKRGDAESGRFALEAAQEILPWMNAYFGVRYPLPKLDIIAAPGGGGFAAMENWGAILFFEQYLLVDPDTTSETIRQFIYSTVAHEIAHMWFGDLVTMEWWDDIWLNEGFASWIQNKVTDELHPEWRVWDQAQGRRQAAMLLDARPSSHPIIVPIADVEQANQAFDTITYEKGYAVVRMIEEFVGEDAFREGVRAYMRRHAYGNTRSPQLWDAIEEASQRPVRAVADDFTRQPGVPLIQVQASACRGGEQTITLRQSEFTSLPVSRAPLLWRTPVAVTPLGGARQDLLTDETRTAQARTTCGPVIINPEQIGYFRTLYDRAAFARLTQSFHRIDAADQLGLLYDLRALGRAGSVSAADFFALAAATPADADPLVWTVIANELAVTDGLFAADDRRRSRYRVFARGLLAPVLQRVGWRRRAGEADNVSILRASLFGALSTLRDPAFEAEALSRYQRDDFDGRVRSTLLSAVAAAASPPVFENMLDRARAATETLEKQTLYGALANVRDPALAARVLELAFDDDIDPALGPDMIATVALNHPDLAFSYALSHEAELAARLDPFSLRSFAPSLAVASNDAAMLGRLRHYIDTEIPDTARRGAEAYHAQLDERLSTRERRLSEIGRWLQAASPARP